MTAAQTGKVESYCLLVKQIEELINTNDPVITNLSNITAAIMQTFDKISWTGFYLTKRDFLYLGPFQGKVACTKIKFGEGVCGNSAEKQIPQVVPDVHKYPGHIACDVESNSEIVIPLIYNNKTVGVLDLDSKEFGCFDETDNKYLQTICKNITDKLDFHKFEII